MYRWDDMSSVSFFPLDQSNFSSPQIETYVSTQLGEFVQRHFEERWQATTTRDLNALITRRIRLRHEADELEPCDVRFVEIDDVDYVMSASLIRITSRYGISQLVAITTDPLTQADVVCDIDDADDLDPAVYQRVSQLFNAKYGVEPGRSSEQLPFMVLRAAQRVLERPTVES